MFALRGVQSETELQERVENFVTCLLFRIVGKRTLIL